MKILVLSNLYPPDTLGGYEMGCRQVVDALRARDHDVRVLTTAARVPVASQSHVLRNLRLTDLWVEYVHRRSAAVTLQLAEAEANQISAFNVHSLLSTIEQFEPDVAYLWSITGIGGLGLLGALVHLRMPWVWHLMDNVPVSLCHIKGRVVPALAREVEKQLRGPYLACSQQLVDEIERQGVRLRGDVEVLPNWVAGPIPPVRSTFYRGERPLRIVAAAAHLDRAYDKGMELLINAAAQLREEVGDRFSLDIYGQIKDSYFGSLIKAKRLADLVELKGALNQSALVARYQDYDVFAFPARLREPFGFAPLEATPSGCVPLMARISGISEWMVHGVHCLKVERTAQGFARVLGSVIKGEIDLEPIGRRAAAVLRRDFLLNRIIPRIEQVLDRAAQQSREGAGTADEAYRLALLAEKVTQLLIQEPYCA